MICTWLNPVKTYCTIMLKLFFSLFLHDWYVTSSWGYRIRSNIRYSTHIHTHFTQECRLLRLRHCPPSSDLESPSPFCRSWSSSGRGWRSRPPSIARWCRSSPVPPLTMTISPAASASPASASGAPAAEKSPSWTLEAWRGGVYVRLSFCTVGRMSNDLMTLIQIREGKSLIILLLSFWGNVRSQPNQ